MTRSARFWPLALALFLLAGCGQPVTETPPTATPRPAATATPPIGVSLVTLAPPTAAVVQTTATPLPTPTVTPTATPIVYLIESGDTLLAIAIARATSVDEIMALNPDIRPEGLQIGQAITLPPPATPMLSAAVGTPIPIRIVVKSVTVYQTPLGGAWLVGEVVNEGEQPVENVQVEISLPAETGAAPVTAVAWVAPSILLPGASAPFAVLAPRAPAPGQPPVAAVIGGATVLDFGSRYIDLSVSQSAITIEENRVTVAGQVQNSGAATAGQLSLVATLYDEQGRVTGYRELRLPGPVAPGEQLSFILDIAPPGGRTVDYLLVVQGLRQEE